MKTILDHAEKMFKIDRSDMMCMVNSFPYMMEDALFISRSKSVKIKKSFDNIIIAGMGGSAMAGDIVQSVFYDRFICPVQVVRGYSLPKNAGKKSLIFVLSYSGNTEETLSVFNEALSKKCQVISITSGGRIGSLSKAKRIQSVLIPAGLPPRAALPYMLVPMLYILDEAAGFFGLVKESQRAVSALKMAELKYRMKASSKINQAKKMALSLKDRIPLIFGSFMGTGAAAYRWKTQFSENSKITAINNVFPELNHNELVNLGLKNNKKFKFFAVFLRDKADNKRVQLRFDITRSLLTKGACQVTEIWAGGTSKLEKLLSLIYLGDYVSVYLALLSGTDPTPVDAIEGLKKALAKK
ncbi:MAG: bifunctional phosphoglucose/phosphomannose isomerase [Candidatus Margulisiibacteriota bacterium]